MDNINIFVSSTCYDLSQIRTDISEFIENSGHNPILSESENFPISPELSTTENCIKIVRENADILVLIVGNRYGSIADNGKSITNNEFLVAKQKGIPIFCFIDKPTLNALNFWQNNKDGNFSNLVDNIQIFEFIEEIRSNSKIWTFPFEKAQDIIRILKIQLSYLFKRSLKVKQIFDDEISDFFTNNLSDKALRILLEKDTIYEEMFLSQILVDEIQKKEFLKNDIDYFILTEPKYFLLDYKEIPNWIQERMSVMSNIINSFMNIINVALPKFMNKPAIPADLKGLYYISVRYATLYEDLVKWIIVTRSTYIGEEFEKARIILSEIANKPTKLLWDFPFEVQRKIDDANNRIKQGETNLVIDCKLNIEIDKDAENKVYRIIDEVRNYYGL